jgi:hypothetical protein
VDSEQRRRKIGVQNKEEEKFVCKKEFSAIERSTTEL